MSTSGRGGNRTNSGRPSGWQHGPTCTIRVPKVFAEKLLEVAKGLDRGLDEVLIIQPHDFKLSSQAKTDQIALSQLRVYRNGKHKIIRLQDFLNLLQMSLDK